jgi:two-component system response regulator RegX3
MSPRVLIVEDEAAIADSLAYALQGEGFDVDTAPDGETALEKVESDAYDLLLLDLMLPGISGLEACRRIRAENAVPIVMLTARTAEVDRVLGLESGADDYVTKPFSMPELLSRVRALLRRRELDRAGAGAVRTVGRLRLDVARHTASIDGRPVLLTRSEFRLVALLAAEPGKPFTREEIVRHLWETDFVGDMRAIDVHVSNLRRKLEDDQRRPRRLVTVRGVGYKLVA